MNEFLLSMLNPNAEDAAKRAAERTIAFAERTSVKVTEEVHWDGFTYGKLEPVDRNEK